MTAKIFFTIKSYFSFVDKTILSESLYTNMFRYSSTLWVSLCAFMLNIFRFIAKFIERLKADNKAKGNVADFYANHSQEDDQVGSMSSTDSESSACGETESSEFSFSFLCEESKESGRYSANTLKYQFMSGKDVCGFMEEPETMKFTVQEMFVDSMDGLISNGKNLETGEPMIENAMKIQSDEKVQEFDRCSSICEDSSRKLGLYQINFVEGLDLDDASPDQERTEHSVETPCSKEPPEVREDANSAGNYVNKDEEMSNLEDYYSESDDISYELQLLPRNVFSASGLKPELENSDDELCSYAENHDIQSGKFEIPFDRLVKEIRASDSPMTDNERKPEIINRESNVNEDTGEEFDDEYIEMEPCSMISMDVESENSSQRNENLHELEYTEGMKLINNDGSEKLGEVSLKWESDSDDDEDEFDILLEHQQLVQQMKMEMKNSKVRGLPTISEEEECETPKMVEDLKPLKIEEKFEYNDCMEEIQKFYKSYEEKMRKLDILNYQSLHAINFIQRRDSKLFIASKRASVSSIKNLSLLSFGLCKQRRIFADPTLKSISKMQSDQEFVYIGQICLSWEILRWQYGKVKELLDLNSQDRQSYNQISGEYQQFQVLMQRFLEDEPFQGPRIQNYVKSRSFCRSLLQVPMIRADSSKDKRERIEGEENAISIAKLAETIKEAMQFFWDFLRADKDESNAILKCVQGSLVDLQAPADAELLMNIRTCLEKKERKIKDIKRSGNCIVKKFQKHQATRPCNALFISQVELKLVSRVLILSRFTTEQLIWCQKKLNSIDIVNRKIDVDQAFLLFPC